jgi:hypothetical protein
LKVTCRIYLLWIAPLVSLIMVCGCAFLVNWSCALARGRGIFFRHYCRSLAKKCWEGLS